MSATDPVFAPCPGGPGVYILQADGADAAYGWVGYVLAPGDDPPADQPITLSDAFGRYGGSYVFAPSEPTAGLAGLRANSWAFLQAQVQRSQVRGLIWLPDPGQANPLPYAEPSRYAVVFLPQPPGNFLQTQANFSLWLGPDNQFTFSVLQGSQVGWSDTERAITFVDALGYLYYAASPVRSPSVANAGLVVQRGAIGGSPVDAVVPLSGRRAGSLVLTTQMTPAITFAALPPSVAFWRGDAATGADTAARFPVIDPTAIAATATLPLATALDPLDPLNIGLPTSGPVTLSGGQLRTGLTVTASPPTWTSWFRSLDGRPISLVPLAGADAGPFAGPADHAGGFAFAAQQRATGTPIAGTGSFQLTPAGDYGLATDGVAAGSAGQTLLPGVFGSERFRFTGWDPARPGIGSRLRFLVAQPAYAPVFPFPDATLTDPGRGTVAGRRLTGVYRTAWATLLGPAPLYQAEPDGGAYYGGALPAGTPLLGSAPPGTAVPQEAGFAVPIAPYAGYAPASAAAAVGAYESQILSATRKTLLGGAGSPTRAARAARRDGRLAADALGEEAAGGWTTTSQGLLAQVADAAGATDFLQVTLAQYQPRAGGAPAAFGFTAPGGALQEALQTSQLFVVAVDAAPLTGFSRILDIADWEFDVAVGEGVQATDYRNVLLLKYADGSLIDWARNPNKWFDAADFSLLPGTDPAIGYTGLSTWLSGYLQDAIDKAATNPLYANIATIAQQPDWRGFLALRASLPPTSALPAEIEGLAAGIDPGRFNAHHFGATLSRVTPGPGGASEAPRLVIDGISSLFGLIDYQDPLYRAAQDAEVDPDTPLAIDAAVPIGFRVLDLQALFVDARMTSFRSRIQLTTNQLFGAAVATTSRAAADAGPNPADPAFPDLWEVQPGNGVVLDGSAVSQNGRTTYVFQQAKPTLFTFDTPALNAITVSRVQFNTLGVSDYAWPSGKVPTITSRFLLWGTFDFPVLGAGGDGAAPVDYDLLSFGSQDGAPSGPGLAYSNLQITMRSPQATPTQSAFAFDPANVAFDLGASTPRPHSLFPSLALQVQSFIAAPGDKTPLDYGFLTVVPEGPTLAALSGGWCGIVYKVNMGSPGALVSAAGFNSTLLVAWSPVAGPSPALFVGISLPGTAPGASVFSLQGVFKITTGAISLQQPTPGRFSIKLADVGATFLGVKKIPDGTIQFFLFGDPDGGGSLGWYAAYKAPADGATTTARIDARPSEVTP